ncbi:MAG: ABC transporter permease [Candidatus Sericytochromatia bacterium]|nr:ABC transporter permease [Candidatus Sericytochromatia bacterium]
MKVFLSLAWSLLAVLAALLTGGVVLALSGYDVGEALGALFKGAFGTPNALAETLVNTTPLLLAALAVALGLRAGLFNIGVEGQFLMGGLGAVVAGYALPSLPWGLHVIVVLVAGMLAGAGWAAIPAWMKARFGAHEVITTIMFNYIAFRLVGWLVRVPLHGPGSIPQTRYVVEGARLPVLWADTRLHAGLIVALAVAAGLWWLLWHTPWGVAIRAVGLNAEASEYAGIRVVRTVVTSLALSGGLAGLAGAVQLAGVDHRLVEEGFSAGYGYDSIAVSLLGANHPFAIVPAALLFASLRSGASLMQIEADVSSQIISVLQALVILFVAAEAGLRRERELKAARKATAAAPPAAPPSSGAGLAASAGSTGQGQEA